MMIRSLPPRLSGGTILDLGCGYGRDTRFFRRSGLSALGLDLSSEAIATARQSDAQADFLVGDACDLPFHDEEFHIVFSHAFIHLFDERERACIIKEAHRVLKPGGIGVFSAASVEDPDYGHGLEVGEHRFENSRGVIKSYYSTESVHHEFRTYESVTVDTFEETHRHDKPHTHKSLLIWAAKERAET
jgi:SAM-dependent methyltransferase